MELRNHVSVRGSTRIPLRWSSGATFWCGFLQGYRSDGAPEPRFDARFYKDAAPTELRNHVSVRGSTRIPLRWSSGITFRCGVLQGYRSDVAPEPRFGEGFDYAAAPTELRNQLSVRGSTRIPLRWSSGITFRCGVLQGYRSDGAPEPRFGAGFYKDTAPMELRSHVSMRGSTRMPLRRSSGITFRCGVLQGYRSDGAPESRFGAGFYKDTAPM